LGWEWV